MHIIEGKNIYSIGHKKLEKGTQRGIIVLKGGETMETKKLLKMMIDRSIKKSQLAKLTGVTDRQVRRITAGQSPGSLNWWRKAAEVLGCDVTEIIE